MHSLYIYATRSNAVEEVVSKVAGAMVASLGRRGEVESRFNENEELEADDYEVREP